MSVYEVVPFNIMSTEIVMDGINDAKFGYASMAFLYQTDL